MIDPVTTPRQELQDGATPDVLSYGPSPELVDSVVQAADSENADAVRALLVPLHAADIASAVGQLTIEQRAIVIDALRGSLDPDVLAELNETLQDEVVDLLEPRELATAITGLDVDDAVNVLENLEATEQREVLAAIPAAERAQVEEGLNFAEQSAGRLMQRSFVAVPVYWNIGQIIDHLRDEDNLPEEFYEIFVVDEERRPLGTVPLNRAMRAKRPIVVGDIMDKEPKIVSVDVDQEEVAYAFRQYDLTSAPVVDREGKLVGVIMVDDVLDVIDEEHEEDMMRMAGVTPDDLYTSVIKTSRSRSTWLAVNAATALTASTVISFFDATIQQTVALAVLMPIVASMGGNTGMQALTVAVRALSTRELTAANAYRLVNKELLVGLLNGALFAVVVGVVAAVWFTRVELGLVLGAAMVINLGVAGLCGILIPLGLDRLGIDPALAASIFLTMITDVVGFLAFLGLAATFLL